MFASIFFHNRNESSRDMFPLFHVPPPIGSVMHGAKYDFSRDRERRAGFDDMVFMSKTTDLEISQNLKIRFEVNYIYTYIGPVLIAINPYKDVYSCHSNQMEKYRGATQMDNAPHIFAIAEGMFSNMLIDSEKQCVIISGESGAGKTVSAKLIMSYVGEVSGGGSNVQRIKEIISQSNPLLEAFGNAKTIRNDNSSRFGKYVEIQFSSGGEPLGGVISNFLLEKSRVISQAKNERNFHIFYQLLSNEDMTQQYGLSSTSYFHYINHLDSTQMGKFDDTKLMCDTQYAMTIIGLSKETQHCLFGLLAGILHLGNVQFNDQDNYASIKSESDLRAVCTFFGISMDVLKTKLISKRLEFKEHYENKRVEQAFTIDKAIFTRDALAKSIYARLFDFLIQAINGACQTSARCDLSLGILDIYGFEIFDRNSFEQFCINYVNEKLQQIFIEFTLKKEQEEYERERIQWSPISFFNNILVCELFEGKQPPGMFLLLDDICTSSHATTDKADKNYLHKLTTLASSSLLVSYPTFIVKHYAGSVTYHSDQFCEKNRDILNTDVIEMMQASSIPFVARLFPEQTSNIKSRPTTAGTKIRTQAHLLIEKLMACQPHYVRCIKPNENQAPGEWNIACVLEQVKYLGLGANIDVRKTGFVYRREFDKFLSRYAILTRETWPEWDGNVINGVLHIAQAMHLDQREVQLGQTKVFIKSPECLHLLEDMRLRKFDHYARIIQKTMKRYCAVRLYQRQREQATEIFFDRKERNARSLNRNYLGDYCNLYERADLHKLIPRHERVDFSSYIYKYDRRFRRQGRYLIITNQALYIIEQDHVKVHNGRRATNPTDQPNKAQENFTLTYTLKRRIPLENLQEIKLSEYRDNFVLICVRDDYGTLLELSSKTEAIAVMTKNFSKKTQRTLPVIFTQGFDYPVKKQTWSSGGTRTVKFLHAATAVLMKQFDPHKSRKTHDATKDYDMKVTNHTMMIVVSNGLPKQSRPNAQSVEKVTERPVRSSEKSLARKTIAKSARSIPMNQDRLRALYDFEARTADEISFRADNELLLIDSRDETWWRVELNGKTGVVPSNYIERLV